MKYNIETISELGQSALLDRAEGKKAATNRANFLAIKYPGEVYVSYHRPDDGQTVFLNPSGNYEITGKAW